MVFDARSSFVLARFELGNHLNIDSSYDRLFRCGFIANTFPRSSVTLTSAFTRASTFPIFAHCYSIRTIDMAALN